MRLLSRLPVRRAPLAVATAGIPAARRERVADAPVDRIDRVAPRAEPVEERPQPLAPARGIAIALGLGAFAWAVLAAFLIYR